MFTTKVQFTGLMVFLTGRDPVTVVVPHVPGGSGADVPKHVPFIAFEKKNVDPDDVTEWGATPFPADPDNFYWATLKGERISFTEDEHVPLRFDRFLPALKNTYCANLRDLKADYEYGHPEAAAHVLLTAGDVGWHVAQDHRIETIVTMHSNFGPAITATYGDQTKTLKFKGEANIIIGNSPPDFALDADPQKAVHAHDNPEHFRFYYRMFEHATGCEKTPQNSDADHNPVPRKPVLELRFAPVIDIACSNSSYP